MPRNWESLAQSTEGDSTVVDFQQALYQLVTQQCLYLRHQQQAVSYRLISKYRNEFKEAAELMGLRMEVSDRYSFCYVAQEVGKAQPMDLKETLFLLTLRHIYHLRASAGDLSPDGEVVVDLPELQESFKALTQRDLETTRSAMEPLIRVAKRQGLAKTADAEEGDAQPYTIVILPGIEKVLSEHAINRFGAALKASLPPVRDASEELSNEPGTAQ